MVSRGPPYTVYLVYYLQTTLQRQLTLHNFLIFLIFIILASDFSVHNRIIEGWTHGESSVQPKSTPKNHITIFVKTTTICSWFKLKKWNGYFFWDSWKSKRPEPELLYSTSPKLSVICINRTYLTVIWSSTFNEMAVCSQIIFVEAWR